MIHGSVDWLGSNFSGGGLLVGLFTLLAAARFNDLFTCFTLFFLLWWAARPDGSFVGLLTQAHLVLACVTDWLVRRLFSLFALLICYSLLLLVILRPLVSVG